MKIVFPLDEDSKKVHSYFDQHDALKRDETKLCSRRTSKSCYRSIPQTFPATDRFGSALRYGQLKKLNQCPRVICCTLTRPIYCSLKPSERLSTTVSFSIPAAANRFSTTLSFSILNSCSSRCQPWCALDARLLCLMKEDTYIDLIFRLRCTAYGRHCIEHMYQLDLASSSQLASCSMRKPKKS